MGSGSAALPQRQRWVRLLADDLAGLGPRLDPERAAPPTSATLLYESGVPFETSADILRNAKVEPRSHARHACSDRPSRFGAV
jgi:hypothetical protein